MKRFVTNPRKTRSEIFGILRLLIIVGFVFTAGTTQAKSKKSRQNSKTVASASDILQIGPPSTSYLSKDDVGNNFAPLSLQRIEARHLLSSSTTPTDTTETSSQAPMAQTESSSMMAMSTGEGGSQAASSCVVEDESVNVYTDYVVGAWGNWSWCSNNPSSTTYVKEHQYSMQIDLGPWQAAWFQNEKQWITFDDFNHIEFWINGGTQSGQNFQVVLSVDRGSWIKLPISNYVTVAANSWTQVLIPFADFGINAGSNITGIGLYNTSSTTVPSIWLDSLRLLNVVGCYTSEITIDSIGVQSTLGPKNFGINTAVWDSHLSNIDTHSRLDDAGISFVRFPGGTTSNQYNWVTSSNKVDGAQYTIDSTDLVDLRNYLGAESLVNVNYGSGTHAEAYNWLYDVTVTQSANVTYWGVGNENYGSWETDWNAYKHDAYTYAHFTKDFYNAAKALNSNLQIGVNGTWMGSDFSQRFSVTNPQSGETQNGWSAVLLETLNNLGITPDFYEIHVYPQGPNREDDSFLLYSATDLVNAVNSAKQLLSDYLGASNQVPIYVTELNSISSKPGKQSRSFTNALFLTDAHARLATENVGCLWWDVHNAEEGGNNNSVTLEGNENYGDFGILATGFGTEPLNTPYPTYHALELLRNFAGPNDNIIQATTNDKSLSVFAISSGATNDIRLLVINRSADRDITTDITTTGFTSNASVTVHTYGESEYQQGIGLSTTTIQVTPSAVQLTFPSYSATVIEF